MTLLTRYLDKRISIKFDAKRPAIITVFVNGPNVMMVILIIIQMRYRLTFWVFFFVRQNFVGYLFIYFVFICQAIMRSVTYVGCYYLFVYKLLTIFIWIKFFAANIAAVL